jgi:phenylacetate-CoA ligase
MAERAKVAQDLQTRIKDNIGISARVEVMATGTMERSQGKAKRVIDLRPQT